MCNFSAESQVCKIDVVCDSEFVSVYRNSSCSRIIIIVVYIYALHNGIYVWLFFLVLAIGKFTRTGYGQNRYFSSANQIQITLTGFELSHSARREKIKE